MPLPTVIATMYSTLGVIYICEMGIIYNCSFPYNEILNNTCIQLGYMYGMSCCLDMNACMATVSPGYMLFVGDIPSVETGIYRCCGVCIGDTSH